MIGPVSGDEADAVMLAVPTLLGLNVVEVAPEDPVLVGFGETEPPVTIQETFSFWTG
jgi:hypothetical protein